VNNEWEFRGRPIHCAGCHTGRTQQSGGRNGG
jgi:hypothetical protein